MGIKIYLSTFSYQALQLYRSKYKESELNILLSYGTKKSDYCDLLIKNRNEYSSVILDSVSFTINSQLSTSIFLKLER